MSYYPEVQQFDTQARSAMDDDDIVEELLEYDACEDWDRDGFDESQWLEDDTYEPAEEYTETEESGFLGWPTWTEPDAPPLYPSVEIGQLLSPAFDPCTEEEQDDDEKKTCEMLDEALLGSEDSYDVWTDYSPVYDLSIRPRMKKGPKVKHLELPPSSPEPVLVDEDEDVLFSSVEASEVSSDSGSLDEAIPWYLLSSLTPSSFLLLRLCTNASKEFGSDKAYLSKISNDGVLGKLLTFGP